MFRPLLFRPRSRSVAKPLKERLAPGNTGRLGQCLRSKCQSAVVNQCWNTSSIQDPPSAMPPVPCSRPAADRQPPSLFMRWSGRWRPLSIGLGHRRRTPPSSVSSWWKTRPRTRPPGLRPGTEAHSVASAQMKAPQQASPGTSMLGFPSPTASCVGKPAGCLF